MPRWLDWPPVWTLIFMGIAWVLALIWAPLDGAIAMLGVLLAVTGIGLMAWSALAFRRAKTTIVPRESPDALVEDGPYRFSRNPIYLADLMLLAGWSLWLGTPAGLLLAWPLAEVLKRRFILPEEALLETELGPPYAEWKARTRRWL